MNLYVSYKNNIYHDKTLKFQINNINQKTYKTSYRIIHLNMKYIRFGKNICNMLITVFNGITPTQIYLNGINGMVIINTKTC